MCSFEIMISEFQEEGCMKAKLRESSTQEN